MLTTVLIVLAAAVLGILIYSAMKPNIVEVRRSTSVDAAPEKIFPLVNDLRAHRSWSPFDADPAMKRTYSGPATGPGAALEFDGGNKTGVGQLAITDTAAPSKVQMSLKMTKPLACDNTVLFTFEPQGGKTNVTWSMRGPQPFFMKVMSNFINCEKMVGGQFEAGLAKLKSLAEA